MTPARLQWGAALGDAPRRFWRRSAAVARRLPQTAAHNDERRTALMAAAAEGSVYTCSRSSAAAREECP